MKKSLLWILPLLFLLTACGGGGGSDSGDSGGSPLNGSPTDSSTDFSLFPPGFFDSGYNSSLGLKGQDNQGRDFSGIYSQYTEGPGTVGSEPAWGIHTNITFQGGGLYALADTVDYYSLDPSSRRLMGYDGDSRSVTVTGLTAIPETARIGDSGPVGVYTDSDGSIFALEWWLQDGFNGRALLVLKSTGRTASGALDNTTETRYLIEPDGTRIWMELESYNTTVDLRVTMNGYY